MDRPRCSIPAEWNTPTHRLDQQCFVCCQRYHVKTRMRPPPGAARQARGGWRQHRAADRTEGREPLEGTRWFMTPPSSSWFSAGSFQPASPGTALPWIFLLLLFLYSPQTEPNARFNWKRLFVSVSYHLCLIVSPSLDAFFPQQQVSLLHLGTHPTTLSQPLLAFLQEFWRSIACLAVTLRCPGLTWGWPLTAKTGASSSPWCGLGGLPKGERVLGIAGCSAQALLPWQNLLAGRASPLQGCKLNSSGQHQGCYPPPKSPIALGGGPLPFTQQQRLPVAHAKGLTRLWLTVRCLGSAVRAGWGAQRPAPAAAGHLRDGGIRVWVSRDLCSTQEG